MYTLTLPQSHGRVARGRGVSTSPKMWRERKNNCLDVFDQIIDSSSKKEKQVYEEYGLETAEEANQPTLKEFGITIKELI